MAKAKVRVQRLTLPTSSVACLSSQQKDEGEEDQKFLEKEKLSQVMEISIMAGEGSWQRPHINNGR
jgi:hypothetical protein